MRYSGIILFVLFIANQQLINDEIIELGSFNIFIITQLLICFKQNKKNYSRISHRDLSLLSREIQFHLLLSDIFILYFYHYGHMFISIFLFFLF